MATSRQIRHYAKTKGISRNEAKEILEVNAMANQVIPVIAQHSMSRISLEEYKQVLPDMMKQAYDNGEMDQPITGLVHNPDTPIINKLTTMSMRVGKNASKERADALWYFMSSMNAICNPDLPAEQKKENKNALRNIFKSVTDRVVA